VKKLGYCNTYGIDVNTCDFMPGGLLVDTYELSPLKTGIVFVIDGVTVPSSDWSDYSVAFAFSFTGLNRVQSIEGQAWGPAPVYADTSIAITRISEGRCVFCAHAPNAIGSESGISYGSNFYSDYLFTYQVAGEIVPEPGTLGIAAGAIAMLITSCRKRSLQSWPSAPSR
jgi:hypothetical protein